MRIEGINDLSFSDWLGNLQDQYDQQEFIYKSNLIRRRPRSDITNKRFDHLVVISPTPQQQNRETRWICKCDCGNEVILSRSQLLHKSIKSCGCTRKMRPLQRNNTSGTVGVSLDKRRKKWRAYIFVMKKRYQLGTYITIEDAINARKEAEQIYSMPISEDRKRALLENADNKHS